MLIKEVSGFSFVKVYSGKCNSVPGRVSITNNTMCETASKSLGVLPANWILNRTLTVYPLDYYRKGECYFSSENTLYVTKGETFFNHIPIPNEECNTAWPCICLSELPECLHTEGTTLNDAMCRCGSSTCSTDTSMFIHQGSRETTNITYTSNGLYCFKSENRCSYTSSSSYFSVVISSVGNNANGDSRLGINSLSCDALAGRRPIPDKKTCEEAATILGLRRTTAVLTVGNEIEFLSTPRYSGYGCQIGFWLGGEVRAARDVNDVSTSLPPWTTNPNDYELAFNKNALETMTCDLRNGPCLCLSAPTCLHTDGIIPNDATCLCGSSSACTVHTGLYCFSDMNLCSGPPCLNTNGSKANTGACKCGGVSCDDEVGLHCFASMDQCTSGPFAFTEVEIGTCDTMAGGNIPNKATCEAAASSIGLCNNPTTKLEAYGGLAPIGDCYPYQHFLYTFCTGASIKFCGGLTALGGKKQTESGESGSVYERANSYERATPTGCSSGWMNMVDENLYLYFNATGTHGGPCSSKTPCLCLAPPMCEHTKGIIPNNFLCQCGLSTCTNSTGLHCFLAEGGASSSCHVMSNTDTYNITDSGWCNAISGRSFINDANLCYANPLVNAGNWNKLNILEKVEKAVASSKSRGCLLRLYSRGRKVLQFNPHTTSNMLCTTTYKCICMTGCPPGYMEMTIEISQTQASMGVTTVKTSTVATEMNCVICPVGKFRSAAMSVGLCEACPKGQFGNMTGASSCFPCGAGKYANAVLDDEKTSFWSCEVCPSGRFRSVDMPVKDVCEGCAKGQYVNNSGEFSCQNCSPGKHAGTGKRNMFLFSIFFL